MSARPLRALRAALYARVSTTDQTTDNQLLEPRRYAEARGWTVTEYVDEGVSGAKESRPALDRLLKDARRRRLDALVVWRLDRLGRNLRHLILTLDELTALGVSFVSLGEGIDTSTPAGRLQVHILGVSLLKTQIGLVLVARFQMAMIRWRNCRGRCGTQLHVECIRRERPEHDGHAIAVRGSLTSCPVGECRVLRGAAIVAVVQTTEVGNGHDRAVGRPRDGS